MTSTARPSEGIPPEGDTGRTMSPKRYEAKILQGMGRAPLRTFIDRDNDPFWDTMEEQ